MLKTRSRGEIAQLKVQLACAERNFLYGLPQTSECFYDILIDDCKNKKVYRAQIKFCNRKGKNKQNLQLRLDNKGSKRIYYTKSMVDWVLVYVSEKDIILKYEHEHFHRKTTITINLVDKNSRFYYEKFIW